MNTIRTYRPSPWSLALWVAILGLLALAWGCAPRQYPHKRMDIPHHQPKFDPSR